MNAREIVAGLGGRWHGNSGAACCPTHPDKTPSLSIADGDGELPLIHCFGGCKFEAVRDALRKRGLWPEHEISRHREFPSRSKVVEARIADEREAKAKAERAERIRGAAAIWRKTQPITGTPAESYLRGRGITIAIPDILRFAYLKHPGTGLIFPSLVAKLQGADSKGTGIHRTFLGAGGKAKANISTPKMAKGVLVGSACRLAEAGPELGVAEGIESGLSAMQLCGVPVWCALGGANMRNIVLPDVVEHIVIYGDNDKAGRSHAERTAETFHRQGRVVQLAFPDSEFDDFNSALKAQARSAAA